VKFGGLYFMRVDELEKTVYVYPIVGGLAVAMAFLDGTISRFWRKIKAEKKISNADRGVYYGLLKQRDKLDEEYLLAMKNDGGQKELDRIRKQIAKINEDIKDKYPDL